MNTHRLNEDALMRRRCREKELRDQYGLNYVQIAERIGVHPTTVAEDMKILRRKP